MPMVALVVVMVAAGAAVAGQWPELRRYLKMKRMQVGRCTRSECVRASST
jgi:hypothetical protein